ncbi:MAG TPA: hypothetical protein VGF17_16130, partial [Phytomonospora sp.]
FNDLAVYMAGEMEATVDALNSAEGWDVEYADAIPTFGGHGACSAQEWINPVRTTLEEPTGDGDIHKPNPGCFPGLCISRASYHPNVQGATSQAAIARGRLLAIGYP